MTLSEKWKYVLICFAAAVLTVALKNYLVYLFHDTALCIYLCPSIFGEPLLDHPFPIRQLFDFQIWIEESAQAAVDDLWPDPFNLLTALVVAPFVEESLYRGPLFLTRKYSRRWPWWAAALALAAAFALSHGRMGLSLLPLSVLGAASAWLVMRTRQFWPSLALHFLFNLYFSSTLLCPFAFSSD